MAKDKHGRVLDKDFEAGITNRAGEFQKEVQGGINRAQKIARDDIHQAQKIAQDDMVKARKYAYEKNDEIENAIKEHPKSFVVGSFLGGFILGALVAKVNK
ncbi:MAG: hypothetical protein WCX64_02275 [Candidatus Micrarchaeia archaeon]